MKQPATHHLKLCEKCRGKGEVMGLVMRIYCEKCSGHGVTQIDGVALNVPSLDSYQQHVRSMLIADLIDACVRLVTVGPESAYDRNNGRGAGGANYTGD